MSISTNIIHELCHEDEMQFIKNFKLVSRHSEHYHGKLLFTLKYPDVNECLSLINIINDLLKIIIDYINDEVVITYTILFNDRIDPANISVYHTVHSYIWLQQCIMCYCNFIEDKYQSIYISSYNNVILPYNTPYELFGNKYDKQYNIITSDIDRVLNIFAKLNNMACVCQYYHTEISPHDTMNVISNGNIKFKILNTDILRALILLIGTINNIIKHP